MKSLLNWLDHRTGYRELIHDTLYENIPGGSRWRYVWGSTLVFTFVVQLITGTFLWMCYSPSAQTAWESVYYVQHQMTGGWLLRGIHHFTAQAMIVLLALHLMQVVIDGAYKAPREINFWLGLVLMQIVLGLSLTGYLLPWDQKGYWATQVATKIMGTVPLVGPQLQRLVVGGAEYGHHTLTRFFALHAGVLPGLLIFFLVLHLALFRRHGITAKDPDKKPAATFWPDQILKDGVACLAVLATVLGLVYYFDGAELGAPADPANAYSAARPEWYFLFLFQFLKYFPGEKEVWGAVYIPAAVMIGLFLMPLIGNRKVGHYYNVTFVFLLLIGAGVLTWVAIDEDRGDPGYLAAVEDAHANAARAEELASPGIPPLGAVSQMRGDPKTQGPLIFKQRCASCHSHSNAEGEGIAAKNPTAPNLYGFASRAWIEGVLNPEKIAGPQYFGGTSHADGEMKDFVDTNADLLAESNNRAAVAAALSAQAGLKSQAEADRNDADLISKGKELIVGELACTDCHKFEDNGDLGSYPDLTGYGSREWLIGMISNPEHERFYGENNDRMPAFAPNQEDPENNQLSPRSISLLVDWLRGDWYEPPHP